MTENDPPGGCAFAFGYTLVYLLIALGFWKVLEIAYGLFT